MIKYSKKMAILTISVVACQMSAMQQIARKSPSLATSAVVAARSTTQTMNPALAARYRSTMFTPNKQSNIFNSTIYTSDGKTTVSVVDDVIRINGKVYKGQAFKDGIQTISLENGKIRINGKLIEDQAFNWKRYFIGAGALGSLAAGYSLYNYDINGTNLPEKELYKSPDITNSHVIDTVNKKELDEIPRIS